MLFGLFSAISFWLHFYAIVLFASLILFTLLVQLSVYRVNVAMIKPVLAGIITFVVLCFPLIIVTIQRFATRTESAPTFGVQGFAIILETFRQMSTFGDWGFLILMSLFIIGLIQYFLIEKNKSLLLLIILLLTFFISFILSFKMPMMPRHLIFLLIIFVMGIGLSYRVFCSIFWHKGTVYTLMAILIVINMPVLVNYYSTYSKEDWRGFSDQIRNATRAGDTVVLVPSYMTIPFDYYYSNRTDNTFEYGASTVQDLNNISAKRANGTLFFVVTSDILALNPKGDEIAWLKENANFSGQNTGIFLFTSR